MSKNTWKGVKRDFLDNTILPYYTTSRPKTARAERPRGANPRNVRSQLNHLAEEQTRGMYRNQAMRL